MEEKYVYLREIFELDEDKKREIIWNNIRFLKKQSAEEKKIEKEKEKQKKEKTRRIKIPLNYCYDYNEITIDENIEYINFYDTRINGHDYLIDIYKTTDNKFYIKIVDISDGNYKNVDFNEFKKKYAQPSLFDFFNI
jgi:hypothetical protein